MTTRSDLETVTISTDWLVGPGPITKTLKCTCGWTGSEVVYRCEARAKHHLNFSHGGGRFMFAGHVEEVGPKCESGDSVD